MDVELKHIKLDESERLMAIDFDPGMIRQATANDAEALYNLVQHTIHTVYPSCYEPTIVEGFASYHNPQVIATDIEQGKVHVLESGGRILATGSIDGRFITRVYVSPDQRGKGYGSIIMDRLEALMAGEHDVVAVESSAVAELFYQHRGYRVVREETWEIEPTGNLPAATLVYKVMEKSLGEERA